MRFFKIHKAFTCAFCRIPASRFARCSWVYLYEVRGRWAWDCRLCRPQRKLRQSPLCPFAFFAPKRTAEEAKAVSPDKCREAAAKKEAGIPCLVFAVRATCESASESPRLRAEGQRCFSLANALR